MPLKRKARLSLAEDIKDLPWVTTPHFSQLWEVKKIWKDMPIALPEEAMFYQRKMEEGEISSAYEASPGPATKFLSYFLSQNETASKELSYSSVIWEGWLKNRPDYDLFKKSRELLEGFAKELGLSDAQARSWANLELWWSGCIKWMPKTLNFLYSQCDDLDEWFDLCAFAAGCEVSVLHDLFVDGSSPLITEVLYAPLKTSSKGFHLPSENDQDFSQAYQQWARPAWQLHSKEIIHYQLELWSNFVLKTYPNPTEIDQEKELTKRWSHLGSEWHASIDALKNTQYLPALLIVGGQGQGKSTMVRDLLTLTTGKSFKPKTVGQPSENIHRWLLMAKWASLNQDDTVLLLDDAEEMLNTTSSVRVLNERKCPIIATITDLKKIPNEVRESFDRIVFLNDMPIAARLEHAKDYFEDEVLALRVARMVKTPQAIEDVASWCHKCNQFDLNTVLSYLHSLERARQASQTWTQFEVEAPLSVEELPPMVCSKTLEGMLDRLVKIFEKPDQFEKLGAQAPKGAFLYGPPGTGKTLFAKHLSARLKLPMLVPDCTALAKNPENIAVLFQTARQQSPCVVLLDEAATLLSPNSPAVHAVLAQLDGVESLEGVFIVATSNSSFIHPSLKRPGRLSEMYKVELPFQEDRVQIWKAYLKDKPLSGDLSEISQAAAFSSQGMTGAEIQEALRKAATEAVLENEDCLSLDRIVKACDVVAWSPASGQDPLLPEHRWRLALHEAGHALMTWRWKKEVARITVRARSDALGMVMLYDVEKDHEMSRQSLLGQAQINLGGIAAEEAILGEYTNGGSADLQSLHYILSRGLKVLGYGGFGAVNGGDEKIWSDQRRRQFEAEIDTWATLAFEDCVQWLILHRDVLENLAKDLLKFIDMSAHELQGHRQATLAVAEPLPLPPPRLKISGFIGMNSGLALDQLEQSTPVDNNNTLHRSSEE
jgi:hypothetical protein